MPTINDMTHGFSQEGADQYLKDLNAKAIQETKELLGDFVGIQTALENGWQGQAEVNFMENFKGAVAKIQNALDNCSEAINSQFSQITNAWIEQDTNMVQNEIN